MKRELQLETQLAKAKAEEKIYHEAMLNEARDTSTKEPACPPLPTEVKGQQTRPLRTNLEPQSRGLPQTALNPDVSEWTTRTKPDPSRYERRSEASSEIAENFLRNVVDLQQQQQHQTQQMFQTQQYRDQQFQQLISHHQEMSLSMSLPDVQVPTFNGDPIDYCYFVRSFQNLIETKTSSDSARLFYLVQYTSGEVQDLMRSCLSMKPQEGYKEATRLLKEKYGQNYKIATTYVDRLVQFPIIKAEDGHALQQFSVLLISCKNTLKEIGYLGKVENPDCLLKIIGKLPFALRLKWRDLADDITSNKSREITFDDVVKFVEKRARALNHPIFGKLNNDSNRSKLNKLQDPKLQDPKTRFNFGVDYRPNESKVKCMMCEGDHILPRCNRFKSESLDGRLKFVRKKGLCYNCLFQGHMVNSCPKNSFCKVTGCQSKHSTFLHPRSYNHDRRDFHSNERYVNSSPIHPREEENDNTNSANDNAQSGCVNATKTSSDVNGAGVIITGLPIVPVKVKCAGSSRTVTTYAFLDAGSNTTFCTEELLKQLGVKGKRTTVSLTTLQNEDNPIDCNTIGLDVFDLNENHMVEIPTVFSTTRLPVSKVSIPLQEDVDKWDHLEGIHLPINLNAEISLLIGNDVPRALEPKQFKECQGNGPYAVRTIFGWTINGPLGRNARTGSHANFIRSDHGLNQQFQKFCNMEFNDTFIDNKFEMSIEDARALEMMESSIQLKSGHYEIALPWKTSSPCLPNNRSVAEHRLELLKRRFARNPALCFKYFDFMDDLLNKGYARTVPTTSIDYPQHPLWYLPHHPVLNPNKPDKVRVVFDCASVFHGSSLNTQLLQGPDLTNNLVGVLTRFREEPVAMMADVESMFHQVNVSPRDYDALRFLWWPGNDLSKEPQEFQMLVHLFGATSSPCCANFALRRTAHDNLDDFDISVIETVKRNFYVDDCLKSVADDEKGITMASDVTQLLARGGFHLTKWVSNSTKVLESIPESERSGSVKNLNFDQPAVERALGVKWDIVTDEFGFKVTIKEKPLTRRGILSIVSSVYDPLGFTAPVLLVAKILMQDLCRSNLAWDDSLESRHAVRWNLWLNELPKIQRLSVGRCVKPPSAERIVSTQLHNFADASQSGYGAVSYLRFKDVNDNIHCSFVMGKSRVAPIKETTIPRLELSAAVVATRLERMIRNESDIKIDRSIFWTDSTCVLSYLTSTSKRFKTFVANRVSTIRETSSPSQWRYVNSAQNPADDASRGLSAEALLKNQRWLRGPEFLWKSEDRLATSY